MNGEIASHARTTETVAQPAAGAHRLDERGSTPSQLSQELSKLRAAKRPFLARFRGPQAIPPKLLDQARSAHGGLLTRSTAGMDHVSAMGGLTQLMGVFGPVARNSKGNATAITSALNTFVQDAATDRNALRHALETFGSEAIIKKLADSLGGHKIEGATALAALALEVLDKALGTRSPAQGTHSDTLSHGAAQFLALQTTLIAAVKTHPNEPARIIDATRKLGASDSGRTAIGTVLADHTPDAAIDTLASSFRTAGLGAKAARVLAGLAYTSLVAEHQRGLDGDQNQASRGRELEIEGLEAAVRLDGASAQHQASLSALRTQILGDAALSSTGRQTLMGKLEGLGRLLENVRRAGRAQQELEALIAAHPPASSERGALEQLQLLQTRAAKLVFIRTQVNINQDVAVNVQQSLLATLDKLQASDQVQTRAALLSLYGVEPQLAALAGTRPTILLQVSLALLNMGLDLLPRFIDELKPFALEGKGEQMLDDVARGDARALARLLPGAKWDEVRWALLCEFTPGNREDSGTNNARQASIDMRHARTLVERELARILPSQEFGDGPPTSATLQALVQATSRHKSSAAEVDLLIVNWVVLCLRAEASTTQPFDPGQAQFLLREAGIDLDAQAMEQHIREGFAGTAQILRVQQQLRVFGRMLGSNRAVAGIEELGVTRGTTNRVAQSLLQDQINAGKQQGVFKVLPTNEERDEAGLRDHASQIETLTSARTKATRELVDLRNQLAQKIRERDGQAGQLRTRYPGLMWQSAGVPDYDQELARKVSAAISADTAMRDKTMRDQAPLLAAQRNGLLEALRGLDPASLRRLAKHRDAPPMMLDIKPLERLLQELGDLDRVNAGINGIEARISTQQARIDQLLREQASLPASAAPAVRKESILAEQAQFQAMIIHAAGEVCKELGSDAAQFTLREHLQPILMRLERLGVDKMRIMEGGSARKKMFSDTISDQRPLSVLLKTWLGQQPDLEKATRAFLAADLTQAAGELTLNSSFAFQIGRAGMLSMAVPEAGTAMIGGVGLAVQARFALENSVRVEHVQENGESHYRVSVLGGKSSDMSIGLSAFLSSLTATVGGAGQRMQGCRLAFDNLANCQQFIGLLVANDGVSGNTTWPNARSVEMLTSEGVSVTATVAATLPDPVRLLALHAGGVLGNAQLTADTGASLTAGVAGQWQRSAHALGTSYTRTRTLHLEASASAAVSSGIEQLDEVLTRGIDAARAKLGREGSASIATGVEISESTQLSYRAGALTGASEMRLTARVIGGNTARALASVARRLSVRDPKAVEQIARWLHQADDQTSFCVRLRPTAQALRHYNWAVAEIANIEKTDPSAAAKLSAQANAALQAALQPVALEWQKHERSEAVSATGAIRNGTAARLAAAGPIRVVDEATASSLQVIERIDLQPGTETA